MIVKWSDNKAENRVQIILNKLETHKLVDDKGEVGWQAFEVDDYFSAIESYLIFNEEIPNSQKDIIINQAVKLTAKSGTSSIRTFFGNINRGASTYLSLPKQNLIMATSISAKYFDDLKEVSKWDKDISISQDLPKKINREDTLKAWTRFYNGKVSNSYSQVLIKTEARNEYEAYNTAMSKLDLLRGTLNLVLNTTLIFIIGRNNRRKPINEITLGSIQTVHHKNGKPFSSIFWYEPEYEENLKDIRGKWEKAKDSIGVAKKTLSKHLYRQEVEDAIRKYVRALDHPDMHVSFLELWIVLEKLTATKNADYDKMVSRSALLYDDPETKGSVIQHLRLYRNSHIHAGQRSDGIEKYVYQLKSFVEDFIRFHLFNYYRFTSIEEANEFLDVSANVEKLREKIKLFKKVLKFRGAETK